MKVEIYSKSAILALMNAKFPQNVAIISFFTPNSTRGKVDYSGVTSADRVFYVGVHDVDPEVLSRYGYTLETYLSEADALAEFIYNARSMGMELICQCDYGQSRSAACAAAVLQHFESRGIDIFADFRYYPNQLVYRKVFDALERRKERHQ